MVWERGGRGEWIPPQFSPTRLRLTIALHYNIVFPLERTKPLPLEHKDVSAIPTQQTAVLAAAEATTTRLDEGIRRAIDWLLGEQLPEGYWVGMLQSNSCMEAQWVLAMHFLGVDDDPKYDGVVSSILREQRSDGSWEVYYDAPAGDINATVECYAALRAAGFSADDERLQLARQWIFDHGGLRGVRVFTRYWLALIGEWPWSTTPVLPPELIYLPKWCPLNVYRFASWARATMLPIALLSARRPVRRLPQGQRLDELFPEGRQQFDYRLPRHHGLCSWESVFHAIDRLLQLYGRMRWQPGRKTAVRLCLEWIIKHQEADGAWSGIQPPWIYSLLALKSEGYPLDHPVLANGLKAFDAHWSYERDGAVYLQASESPVWDTLLSMQALLDCRQTEESSVDDTAASSFDKALAWLLDQQVTADGDWQMGVPRGTPSGGWAFERANLRYPDVDDTAVALAVLARVRRTLDASSTTAARIDEAIGRAVPWMLALQCSGGGWAAFDRNNTSQLVTKIPFSDFGEMLDPPSVDVTAHVIEALALLGYRSDCPAVARAIRYIKSEQEADGSWFGRWGVNHIYGTAAVLPALAAIGEDTSATYIRRAADWIAAHQNDDDGWGESCASYMDDSLRGVGPSTASQTAWALVALLSVDTHHYDDVIRHGVDYLLSQQRNGTWDEPYYTGTGFPGYSFGARADLRAKRTTLDQGIELSRAFMINYNMYRHYFPLTAIARAKRHLDRA